MARLVYACRFEIPSQDGLIQTAAAYREWLNDHYKLRLGIKDFAFAPLVDGKVEGIPTDHLLSSNFYEASLGKAIRIHSSFPDQSDAGLRWANDIRVGQFSDRCSVEHQISIESTQYNIAPAKLIFGSPRVVRRLCQSAPTYVGEMQVRATPYNLNSTTLNEFISLLSSDLRKLPIVLLSPYARGEPNLLDATHLARNLAAVAIVVQAANPEVTWDFADEVGRQLSCFNGGARIYWPGFSKKSDPYGHRLFFGAWIEQSGKSNAQRAIERAIFAVGAFRFSPDHRISDVIRAVEITERQRQFSEKKASGDNFWEDYERDLGRLDEALQRIHELESENENLKQNQQILISSSLVAGDTGEPPETEVLSFSSVSEAVEVAAKKCNNIELLETAFQAAQESPFQRPFDIYKALVDLDEITAIWRAAKKDKGSGGDLLHYIRERGWGKRSSMHISDTTRGQYRSHYEFHYQGKKQLFEPHITIGSGDRNSCASIHFVMDHAREKIVIAHVGAHLPNTKT